ncbi:hypothetical protein Hanom_Chr07g00634191 [Helianthus anomalus]
MPGMILLTGSTRSTKSLKIPKNIKQTVSSSFENLLEHRWFTTVRRSIESPEEVIFVSYGLYVCDGNIICGIFVDSEDMYVSALCSDRLWLGKYLIL